MWDVKKVQGSGSFVFAGFYLNYVGCKAEGSYYIELTGSPFYLNYVGCKELEDSQSCA